MSRIGKMPVAIPSGVTVKVDDAAVAVKGPKGELSAPIVTRVAVKVEDNEVLVERDGEDRQARSNHGLMRALINNMVVGVSVGFTKELQVVGVGYRATVKGSVLELQLGYSHPIEYAIPTGIAIEVDRTNKITVAGCDKQQVGQVSAKIRAFRRPDSYKGKGVRYVNEVVRIKAGKSA